MALQVRCRGELLAEIPSSVLKHFGTLVDMRECADPDGAGAGAGAGEDSATAHVVEAADVSHDALVSAIKFYTNRATEDPEMVKEDTGFVRTECSNQIQLTDLLCVANYLGAQVLLNAVVAVIADILKDKSAEEILEHFDIKDAFTPEEEAAATAAHPWLVVTPQAGT